MEKACEREEGVPNPLPFIYLILFVLSLPSFPKIRVGIDFDSYSIKYSVYEQVYEGFSAGTNIRYLNKEKKSSVDIAVYYTESYYVYTKYKRWNITSSYSKYYNNYNLYSGLHYIISDSIYTNGTIVIFAGTEYSLIKDKFLIGFDTSLSMYRNKFFSLNVSQFSPKFKWKFTTSLIPIIYLETAVYYINPFENFEFIPKDDLLSTEVSLSARFRKVMLSMRFMTGEQMLAVKNRGYSVNTSFTTKKKRYTIYAKYYVLPAFTINAGVSKTFAEYFGIDYYYDSYSVGIKALY